MSGLAPDSGKGLGLVRVENVDWKDWELEADKRISPSYFPAPKELCSQYRKFPVSYLPHVLAQVPSVSVIVLICNSSLPEYML